MVSREFLLQFLWFSGVELDTEVKGERRTDLHLFAHFLRRVDPVGNVVGVHELQTEEFFLHKIEMSQNSVHEVLPWVVEKGRLKAFKV